MISNNKHISTTHNNKFNKLLVDTGLMIIKVLVIIKKIIEKIIKLIAKLLVIIFKVFFRKPLIKIYYQLFKLKHNEFIKSNILKTHFAIFTIIILSLILLFSNILGDKRAKALETGISHTIMSNIIPQDFSGQNNEDVLVEEGFDSHIDTPSPEKNIPLEEFKNDTLISQEGTLMKPKHLVPTTTKSDSQRRSSIDYTVKAGDTISTIARKFGLKVNTILWANNLNSFSLIHPGDKLTILPKDGIMYKVKKGDTLSAIAKKFSTTEKTIRENNNLGSILKIGEELFIAGGKQQTYTKQKTKSSYTGITAIKNFVKPADKKVTSSNKMLWPTEGHRITQYFSWRHSGLDIANKIGTPLYAADAGKVVYAGWSRGYGYNVVIDHGGGKKTRYAHASKLYVKVGDVVKKGQTIAAMGSTGWSTGPHIHFEVIINGKRYNPLNYIK